MSNNASVRNSLKNTGLVGGSKLISIFISIIRGKFVAILLGPSGMGLVQLFQSTITLVQTICGLGIGFSGVRDVAESFNSENEIRIGEKITTLKRWSWFTGLLGVFITLLISKKLSFWTFGNEEYWLEISVLSISILLANVAEGYSAIIRGTRRMQDYAKIGVINSVIGSILAIVIYYIYGIKGVVPVILLMALINLVVIFFYSKRIKIVNVNVSFNSSFYDGLSMVKLGIFTVFTGFIMQLSLYYVRISINDHLGMESVGFYGVATTLAVTYMGLIFSAMGADYYPKLSAINKDNDKVNKAVLEQTKIILLLGTPLILAMFTFSEFIIQLLYTKEFTFALPLLMWMLLSVFLRLIGFPIGYVFLAKARGNVFIFTQTLWNVIFVLSVLFLWNYRGDLVGVGMAFTFSYILGVSVNVIILKRITSFKYDKEALIYISLFAFFTIIYFTISYLNFNQWYIFISKIIGLLVLTIYCFKKIELMVDLKLLVMLKNKLFKNE